MKKLACALTTNPPYRFHEVVTPPAPTLASATPDEGSEDGGVDVTLAGTGLEYAHTVTFGGVDAFFRRDGANLIARPKPHALGLVDVVVTSRGGSATLVDGYEYTTGVMAAAPVVTSITGPSVVAPAGGGNALVINGTDFVSGCTCEIGGVAGAVTFVSATRIDVVPGAHASGVVNVVVENPDTQDSGASGNGLVEYFEPHDLGPTCELLPGAYSVAGVQGVNAVGTWTDVSGNGYDAVSPSGTDAPVAASGCPDFDGATSSLHLVIAASLGSGAGSPPDMATLTAGTQCIGFNATATDPATSDYNDAVLACGSGASAGMCINDDGFQCETYDEGTALYDRTAVQAAANGTAHIGFCRWSTTTFSGRVNGGAFQSVTITHGGLSDGNVGAATEIGRSFAGTQYFNGVVMFYLVFATAISDANCDKIRAWAQQRGYVA